MADSRNKCRKIFVRVQKCSRYMTKDPEANLKGFPLAKHGTVGASKEIMILME